MTQLEHPAFVCSHVFNKTRPILYVSRADGDWQFLCGGTHPADEVPHLIGINHLFEEDPTLEVLRSLPPEWEAERETANSLWKMEPNLMKR